MPAPDSTNNATRDRAPTVGAPTDVSPPADAPTSAGSDAPTDASPKAASRGKDKGPACPTCGGALETYLGAAAHKLGSFWCHTCGVRHRLPSTAQQAPQESAN